MNSQQWPEPKAHLHVRVVDSERDDTHVFLYRSDGLLAIETDPDAFDENTPEFVKKTVEQTLVNRTGRQALRRLMDRIDLMEAQAS